MKIYKQYDQPTFPYQSIAIGALSLAVFTFLSQFNFLLFHCIAEGFSILIGFSIFIIAWNVRKLLSNHFLLFLGVAFLFIGGLDSLHTITYKGMGVFLANDANLPTQLWIAARYMESITFLVAPLFLTRKINPNYFFIVFIAGTSLALVSIFYYHNFPICFVDGKGLTTFKKTSEYVICFILLLSLWHLTSKSDLLAPVVLKLIAASLVSTVISELFFTFYVSVYGLSNVLGHYFKILSVYCLYRAIVETGLSQPYALLFKELKDSEQASRASERKFEESEKRFRCLYEEAPLPYQSLDANGYFLDVNQSWLDTLGGYTKDEVLGRSFGDFLLPEWKEHFKLNFPHFKDKGEILEVEFEMVKKDGSVILVHFDGKIAYDEQGDFLHTHCIFQDLTQQHLAENALRESEKKYRRFFSTVNNGWAYHKVVTDENNKPVDYIFLEINKAYEKLTGLTREDIIGKRVSQVLPGIEHDPANWIGRFGEVALSGKSSSFENYVELLQRWYSVSVTCPEQGYFIVVFDDITRRKQADMELLRTMKELQDVNAELAQFNYAVAHDLKAPIRAMSNYSDFLQKDLASLVSGEQKTYLTRLRQTAVETGRMIEDLLQLAKIGSQKQQVEEIELGDFMEKLVSSMDLSQDIEINMDNELPAIMSDPLLLRQIFQNLIENAGKYNIVSPKRIAIGCLPETDKSVTCYVRDNGIGIAAEYREQIFGLFERLHSPKEYSGTGVGLAIVKKAINRLGGTIRVESMLGKGSTFYVALPVDNTIG